jgi:MFS-type transporter involved in bile tolerance (Atg22 family)
MDLYRQRQFILECQRTEQSQYRVWVLALLLAVFFTGTQSSVTPKTRLYWVPTVG